MDEQQMKELLLSVDVFSDLPDDLLSTLCTGATVRTYRPGFVIFSDGDASGCFYVVAQGLIEIARGETVLAVLGEREIFGEMGALDQKPRAATARATHHSTVLRVPRVALVAVASVRRSIEMKIRRRILERHRENISTTFHKE